MIELILFSKPGCHLCEDMKEIIFGIKNLYSFKFKEIDINTDKYLFAKYSEKIPVLLVDGKLFAKFTLNEEKLKLRLSRNT